MWPFDEMIDILNWIPEFLVGMLDLVLYGPMTIMILIYNEVVGQINLVLDFINNFITLYGVLVENFLGMFDGVYFDSFINWVLAASILVVIVYRVYHFLNNVSIAGFKI